MTKFSNNFSNFTKQRFPELVAEYIESWEKFGVTDEPNEDGLFGYTAQAYVNLKRRVEELERELKQERGQEPLYPILLTKEMLKANGFADYNKVMQYCFNEDGNTYTLTLKEAYNEDWEQNCWGVEIGGVLSIITYVHELQSLLRLAGLNELAGNFNIKEV